MDPRVVKLCYARCYTFLNRLNVIYHMDNHVTNPLCRYILGIPCSLPIRHVIVGERPYGTPILPYVASAMSYDPDVTGCTPSVHYIARDIDNHTDMDYDTAHDWFRDSWKYLRHGILILNICTYRPFMDPLSDRERVATEELVRDLVKVSVMISGERVHICSMGNPAQHSADRIRSSIPRPKLHVIMHRAMNPAWPSHKKGDQRSPDVTLGGKSIIKYLHGVVSQTIATGSYYTIADFDRMSSPGEDIVTPVVNQSRKLATRFEEIEAAFKASPDGKTIDNGETIFRQAKEEMTQFVMVMQMMKTRMMFMNIPEPAGAAKQTYMNKRYEFKQQDSTYGRSSRVSSTTSNTPLSVKKLGFVDDDSNSDDGDVKTPTTVNSQAPNKVPTTATTSFPVTPTRKPVSVSAYSSVSRKSSGIGFVAEESDEDSDSHQPPSKLPNAKVSDVSNNSKQQSVPANVSGSDNDENFSMSKGEVDDMEYVAAFIEDDEEYDLDPAVVNTLREAIKSSRAQSSNAKEVLRVIRVIRADPKIKAVKLALGFVDNIIDMPSPITQWLLANVVSR